MLGVISAVILEDSAKENYNFEFLCPSALTVNILSTYFLATASFLAISAIALERFLAVALHLRYQELVTERRVNIAIAILWITSGASDFGMLTISSDDRLIGVVSQSVGLFVIAVAYFRIFKVVRYHQNQIHSQHQIQNGQAVVIFREKIRH